MINSFINASSSITLTVNENDATTCNSESVYDDIFSESVYDDIFFFTEKINYDDIDVL